MKMINYFTRNDYLGAIRLLVGLPLTDELAESQERSKFIHDQVRLGNKLFSRATMKDIGLV